MSVTGEKETRIGIVEKNEKQKVESNEKTLTDDIPKFNHRGWRAMPYIIGNETFEKLGAIGTLANLLVYLTTVFNLKSIAATNMINIFNGCTNFATLLGAFLSDTYFGRYKTLGFCTIASFLGLLMIQLTAAIKNLHPPHCIKESSTCEGPTTGQMAFLLAGFGSLLVGAAGIRPCNLAFGADQFNPNTESGKKGINSFFNWYFVTIYFAVFVSLTLIVYIQSNLSWAVGLAIPAALMLLSCVVFYMGSKVYVKVEPTGSPATSIVQVIVVAIKKRHLKLPENPSVSLFSYMPPESMNSELAYTYQFRLLDKAAIMTPKDQINHDGSPTDPWNLCSVQQVEEVKCLLRVIPIWFSALIFFVAGVQQNTLLVFQAVQSDRRFGHSTFKIPAATYSIFSMLTMSIWLPLYDRKIVPRLRRLTKKDTGITLLQRMGIGMFLAIICMLVSAIVEEHRRTLALTKPIGVEPRKGAISSMSGLWFIPQLVLSGLAEAFTSVGQVEFYYKQFPENMRSIAGSLFFCGMAGSSYLSTLLISIVHQITSKSSTGNWIPEDLNKGRLDYFYYVVAAIEVLNFGYFLLCATWYKYKETGRSSLESKKTETSANGV
ncbi:protein NRT1/ PTR FAMILY 2.9 [Neltuma alba]|uniref:protein NRT1/ PTR FAMILY 2.9 n=1 Tax=Neltuma alba TaxID=207710 RepID=UPI0010A43209|nr:protein NRT1/ PTR FAMILY 2.9 [Prosopis alba]